MVSTGQKKKNFNVLLKNLGCFPHRRKPRVLWLGVEPLEPLIDLHAALAVELDKRGLLEDRRPYRAHLTLGRFKQPPRNPDALCPFLSQECGNLKIDQLVLYHSRLTRNGAVHTPLRQVDLMQT
jgi:2'-5' RNA ligase